MKKKGFSLKDITKIGRTMHNLDDKWEGFRIDTKDYPHIHFGLGIKDENGEWTDTVLYDSFNADEIDFVTEWERRQNGEIS